MKEQIKRELCDILPEDVSLDIITCLAEYVYKKKQDNYNASYQTGKIMGKCDKKL